jgi:hypothetical protein
VEKSKYSTLSPTVIYHGLIGFFQLPQLSENDCAAIFPHQEHWDNLIIP